jgi:hypothetical protein
VNTVKYNYLLNKNYCVVICAVLGYYAAFSVNFLPKFRNNLSLASHIFKKFTPLDFLNLEDATDTLLRNVDTQRPLYAA